MKNGYDFEPIKLYYKFKYVFSIKLTSFLFIEIISANIIHLVIYIYNTRVF